MEDVETIVEVVQDDEGVTRRSPLANDHPGVGNTSNLLNGLRMDAKKDSGYGSQGVLGLETLRVKLFFGRGFDLTTR